MNQDRLIAVILFVCSIILLAGGVLLLVRDEFGQAFAPLFVAMVGLYGSYLWWKR